MAARTLPNIGLEGGYDERESGWAEGMTANLLMLAVLVQSGVIDKVSATPGSPDPGDIYLFDDTHPTEANAVAVFEGDTGDETWTFYEPLEGWLVYNRAEGYYEKFDGTAWAELETGGGTSLSVVTEISGSSHLLLASDAGLYLRFTNSGSKSLTVQPDATEPMPSNGEWHIRNAGATDLILVEGSGVTLHPPAGGTLSIPEGGTITLKRVATDEFDILGQTVSA